MKEGVRMKIEEGTVVGLNDNGLVDVKVGRHSDCISCGACDGAQHIIVQALNPVGAKVGQHVKFEMREVNIVIGAFVCFIMPLLVAAAGVFIGRLVAQSQAMDVVNLEIAGGIIGFLIGVVGVKLFDRKITNDANARPKIVEVVQGR